MTPWTPGLTGRCAATLRLSVPPGRFRTAVSLQAGRGSSSSNTSTHPPARFQITAAAPQCSTLAPHLISDIVTTVAASHRHKHDNLPPADNDDVDSSRPPPLKTAPVRCGVPGSRCLLAAPWIGLAVEPLPAALCSALRCSRAPPPPPPLLLLLLPPLADNGGAQCANSELIPTAYGGKGNTFSETVSILGIKPKH